MNSKHSRVESKREQDEAEYTSQ